MADVLVVGAGLIGTSLGLALRGERDVMLTDTDPRVLAEAVDRGAGRPWDGVEMAELAVACVPPRAVMASLERLHSLGVARMFSHTASVQSRLQQEVETVNPLASAVCGSHPLAGKETSGPRAASASLFDGRPWVLCPGPQTRPEVVRAVTELVVLCGAEPVELPAPVHDAAVALVSHLPQVAASAVAAQLTRADPLQARLGGPGLRDTTRVAASSPQLWTELLAENAAPLLPVLRALSADLEGLADALQHFVATGEEAALGAVREFLRRGQEGRALVPVKQPGSSDHDFVSLGVSVSDRPGELARLLGAAAAAGTNVEDVSVEHLRGRPRGVVRLAVLRDQAARLERGLRRDGWELVD